MDSEIEKTKLIRKLIKIVTKTTPMVMQANADGVITKREKKLILRELLINIISVLFEKDDVNTVGVIDAVDEL